MFAQQVALRTGHRGHHADQLCPDGQPCRFPFLRTLARQEEPAGGDAGKRSSASWPDPGASLPSGPGPRAGATRPLLGAAPGPRSVCCSGTGRGPRGGNGAPLPSPPRRCLLTCSPRTEAAGPGGLPPLLGEEPGGLSPGPGHSRAPRPCGGPGGFDLGARDSVPIPPAGGEDTPRPLRRAAVGGARGPGPGAGLPPRLLPGACASRGCGAPAAPDGIARLGRRARGTGRGTPPREARAVGPPDRRRPRTSGGVTRPPRRPRPPGREPGAAAGPAPPDGRARPQPCRRPAAGLTSRRTFSNE